jgi:FkbM family methyltransferase
MIDRLEYLKDNYHLPQDHIDYLIDMRNRQNIYPRVIYDIGACTLHWALAAQKVWPKSYIIAFEGMQTCAELYQRAGIAYHIDLLGEQGRLVDFYENPHDPAGNSYYQENPEINPQARIYYNESHRTSRTTRSLDHVVLERKFHTADLIKMDVQGAELDILRHAPRALAHAENIILETQSQAYNQGAPFEQDITQFLLENGFQLTSRRFSGTSIQGDSHFGRML